MYSVTYVPIYVAIDGVNRHDMKPVRSTLDGTMPMRPVPTALTPQVLCLDKGYVFGEVRDFFGESGFTAHIRARGDVAKGINLEVVLKALQWRVVRGHGWMDRFSRILVRREEFPKPSSSCRTLPAISSPGVQLAYRHRLLATCLNY